jgi:hypothetical protein
VGRPARRRVGSARAVDRSDGRGFFQAQRDGDCEHLLALITEASWSDGGRHSRAELLEQCAAAVEGYEPEVEE